MSRSKRARKRKNNKKKKKSRLSPALDRKSKIDPGGYSPKITIDSRSKWVAYDEDLLDRVRTQWLLGDWESLVQINEANLKDHPAREKVALLLAAAHQQLGGQKTARLFFQQALAWGCPRRSAAQVLIAGVHNTLGRAASLLFDESRMSHHFEASLGEAGGGESGLLTHFRSIREMTRLGLINPATYLSEKTRENLTFNSEHFRPGREFDLKDPRVATGNLSWDKSSGGSSSNGVGRSEEETSEVKEISCFNQKAYEFYVEYSDSVISKERPPYILLNCKSIPRSGLHYMKNTIEKIMREQFTFCEWYQEPGCCKTSPCALTLFAEQCAKKKNPCMRLIKSHDFNLSDPVFESTYSVRNIILIRNPLFVLTSYFALGQLSRYQKDLGENGIAMPKIWLSHEPLVLEKAYQILDESFTPPGFEALSDWLHKKSTYMIKFLSKWVGPAVRDKNIYTEVVRYENINKYIGDTLMEMVSLMDDERRRRTEEFVGSASDAFQARKDPFEVPSEKISKYIVENSEVFLKAAKKVREADKSGLMEAYG